MCTLDEGIWVFPKFQSNSIPFWSTTLLFFFIPVLPTSCLQSSEISSHWHQRIQGGAEQTFRHNYFDCLWHKIELEFFSGKTCLPKRILKPLLLTLLCEHLLKPQQYINPLRCNIKERYAIALLFNHKMEFLLMFIFIS